MAMPFVGELSALVTAILWSGTALVFSSAIARVGSTQVNITRMWIALVLLTISIAVLQPAIDLSATQLALLATSGAVGLVFGDTFLFRAFQEVGPRISMLVMSLAPALSSIFAYVFLGEVMSWYAIGGMVVTIGGIAIVVLERQPAEASHAVSPIGVLYAFLGALGQAGGLIFAKQAFMLGEVNAFVATFVRIAASVALITPVMYYSGRYRNPFVAYRGQGRALLLTSTGAVIGPWLGITFSLIAVANAQVGVAATIMAMPPIIMLPMLVLVFKQKLNWVAYLGALLAVAGVGMLFLA